MTNLYDYLNKEELIKISSSTKLQSNVENFRDVAAIKGDVYSKIPTEKLKEILNNQESGVFRLVEMSSSDVITKMKRDILSKKISTLEDLKIRDNSEILAKKFKIMELNKERSSTVTVTETTPEIVVNMQLRTTEDMLREAGLPVNTNFSNMSHIVNADSSTFQVFMVSLENLISFNFSDLVTAFTDTEMLKQAEELKQEKKITDNQLMDIQNKLNTNVATANRTNVLIEERDRFVERIRNLFSFRTVGMFFLTVTVLGLGLRFSLWGFPTPSVSNQITTTAINAVAEASNALASANNVARELAAQQIGLAELASRNPANFSILTQPATDNPYNYSLAMVAGALIMRLLGKK